MTDHLEMAENALVAFDDVGKRSDELVVHGHKPGALQDRLAELATAAALVDIAKSLRKLTDRPV